MENQIIEQLTAATSKSCETMKSLGDINSNAFRKINDLQFDFIISTMATTRTDRRGRRDDRHRVANKVPSRRFQGVCLPQSTARS